MIFLYYYDLKEQAPYEEGQYLVFMNDGTVVTGFWSKETNAFMVDWCRGVYYPQEDIVFWADIPSIGKLETNLYKEL